MAHLKLSLFRYLRPQNPYQPPTGVQNIVDELKTASKLKTGYNGTTFNLEDKFNFLSICAKEFNHPVPSSLLHEINTISMIFARILASVSGKY